MLSKVEARKNCILYSPILGQKYLLQSVSHYLDKLNLVIFAYSDLVLGLNKLMILPQLHQKMTLTSKVVKRDLKISILIH
jgi:hypothetical protein